MYKSTTRAVTVAALLSASTLVSGHVTVEGPVEADGGGYIGTEGGLVILTEGSECLRTSHNDEDNQIDACEGVAAAAEEPAAEPEETTAAEPVTPEVTVVQIARSIKADFASGSAEPSAAGEAEIAALISELSQMQEITAIDISGHTDSRGSEAGNQKLSEARAETVRSQLASAFPDAKITSTGDGESKPIASNETAEGRSQNRRVDVNVTAKTVQN